MASKKYCQFPFHFYDENDDYNDGSSLRCVSTLQSLFHLIFIISYWCWCHYYLKTSLVFPILLFSSISLHWSLRKAFLSLLAILWNSAFRCLYLPFSPLLFISLLWRPTRSFRTNTQKRCHFHYRGLECKSRKSRNTLSNKQIWPWNTEWSRAKANRVLLRKFTGHSKHPLPTTQEKTLHMDITRWSTPKSDWLYSLQPKMEKLYAAAAAAKLLQSCPTLCNPIDDSPPGSLVPGILQARTLEWVAISFSKAW